MNRGVLVLILAQSLWGSKFGLEAQGVLNFANIGGGVNAPIVGPDGLLGAGWFAQLQLADGTNIGESAPFLANGLFSGGTRVVPGVPYGVSVIFQVYAFNEEQAIGGASDTFYVTLGTEDNAAALSGMPAFYVCNLAYCSKHNPDILIPRPLVPQFGIGYRLLENGELELRWPVGKNLVRSREPGGVKREPVGWAITESGTRIRTFKTSGSQFFFWLEE